MALSVGIVGLPNVGKSTLFNALLKKQAALAANYPFATVEPNNGMAVVPDDRLEKIARVWAENDAVGIGSKNPQGSSPSTQLRTSMPIPIQKGDAKNLPPLKPAMIEFVDIAGLVAGASKGEGLGNKFLANIRECDLICHVMRAFEDGNVVQTGKLDPVDDLDTIRTELILKDLETVEKVQGTKHKVQSIKEKKTREDVLRKVADALGQGKMANSVDYTDEEMLLLRDLHLLTMKPEIFVVNVSEEEISDNSEGKNPLTASRLSSLSRGGIRDEDVVFVSAKIEAEIAELEEDERIEFMKELGLEHSGLEMIAKAAYEKLNLISFLTVGEIESKAWTIRGGATAPEAAGVIHTDFAKRFIKAQVIGWKTFIELGGWKKAREVGKVRQEGKDYVMQDGDVVEFMIGK